MVRQWCAVALVTGALLLAAGLSFAAGHGGGGHGGGGHGGGGHGGGGHAGGMAHGGGFHAGGFHSGVAHGSFHNGHFHNGHFHNGHFHNGSNFFFGVGLGGWGWGWGYPWGYGGYYGGYYPGSYDGWYTGDYTVPVSTVPVSEAYGSVPVGSTYYSSPATAAVALTAPPADNVIYVDIRVPADAEVWVEGQRMSQKGPIRLFESPPVTPGVEYVYHIRAHWKEQGQDVDEVREAMVHVGSKAAIDFTKRTREIAPPPRPKAPPPPPQPKAGVDGV